MPDSSVPSVSIIMNCLNAGKDLADALASVSAQTFQDFEIIFWDNGSTDISEDIARAYGPQLRFFKSEKTVPLGAARNLAIAQSRGEFIAFLDCDDLWRPEKLARQVEVFRNNTAVGLVCTDTEIWDGKRVLSRVFDKSMPARGHVFSELMTRQWISMSSAMLRRKALDGLLRSHEERAACQWFDERLNVCEEADVFYRIAHDWELDFIDEPLTVWRVHGGNTTFRKFGQFADETLLILEKHRVLYPDYDATHPELVDLLTRRAAFQKGLALWKEGKNADARKAISDLRDASPKFRLFWYATFLPGALFNLLSRLYFALPARFRK